jgi:hypothetical protein
MGRMSDAILLRVHPMFFKQGRNANENLGQLHNNEPVRAAEEEEFPILQEEQGAAPNLLQNPLGEGLHALRKNYDAPVNPDVFMNRRAFEAAEAARVRASGCRLKLSP